MFGRQLRNLGEIFTRVIVVVVGFVIIVVGPLSSFYLFAGCPAIPNSIVGCSLAYSLGSIMIWLSLLSGSALAILGTFVHSSSYGNMLQVQPLSDGTPVTYPNSIAHSEADKHALSKLRIFAIITLAGSIIAVAFFVLELLLFPNLFSLSGMWATVPVQNTQLYHLYASAILAVFVATNALTVLAIFPLRSALADLSRAGSPNLRFPRMMMLFMLSCILVSIAGRLFDPQISSPLPHWADLIFLYLLLVGTYGTMVGEILGETLGIWRMGSRYNENMFKWASIALIFPIAQVVSPILIFIGQRKISRNLS